MPSPEDHIRQTVQALEEGGLSAAGRAEDRKNLIRSDAEVDIAEGLDRMVTEIEIPDGDLIL
jgi:hypothetical protein